MPMSVLPRGPMLRRQRARHAGTDANAGAGLARGRVV